MPDLALLQDLGKGVLAVGVLLASLRFLVDLRHRNAEHLIEEERGRIELDKLRRGENVGQP